MSVKTGIFDKIKGHEKEWEALGVEYRKGFVDGFCEGAEEFLAENCSGRRDLLIEGSRKALNILLLPEKRK